MFGKAAAAISRVVRISREYVFGDGFPIRSEEERLLLTTCEEEYLRDPYRERLSDFRRIIKEFCLDIDGRTLLDLGPGHMGFFEMCRRLGRPLELIGVERSPTLIEIGRRRGYKMIQGELTSESFTKNITSNSIELLFCRGSLNPAAVPNFSVWWDGIRILLRPSAQIWICPWWGKSIPLSSALEKRRTVHEVLKQNGVTVSVPPRWLSRGYDVHFSELWIR
jgi:hypothetical protein